MDPDSHRLRQALCISSHLTDELLMREDAVSLQQTVVFNAETPHFKLKTIEPLSRQCNTYLIWNCFGCYALSIAIPHMVLDILIIQGFIKHKFI